MPLPLNVLGYVVGRLIASALYSCMAMMYALPPLVLECILYLGLFRIHSNPDSPGY